MRPFFPRSGSLLDATSGLLADLACRKGALIALVIDYDPQSPPVLANDSAAAPMSPGAVAERVVPFGGVIAAQAAEIPLGVWRSGRHKRPE